MTSPDDVRMIPVPAARPTTPGLENDVSVVLMSTMAGATRVLTARTSNPTSARPPLACGTGRIEPEETAAGEPDGVEKTRPSPVATRTATATIEARSGTTRGAVRRRRGTAA